MGLPQLLPPVEGGGERGCKRIPNTPIWDSALTSGIFRNYVEFFSNVKFLGIYRLWQFRQQPEHNR